MTRPTLKRAIKKLFNFDVFDYQAEFVYDCLTQQRTVGIFCRQSGKSLCLSFVAVFEALRINDGKILIIAPTDLQAGLLFEKITSNLRNSLFMSEVVAITKRTALFKNNTTITAHTVGDTGAAIRGLTGHVIIEEEAAFIRDKINHEVIMPMGAATNGKYIKISSPFGMNHFYESAMSLNWKTHKISWEVPVAAGLIKQEFIDEQKALLTSLQFNTEYGAVFIKDEDAYFKVALIQNCISDHKLIEVNY